MADFDKAKTIYEFTVLDINGKPVKLDVYAGHALIVVNVASQSPFAEYNYKILNRLYEKYADSKGLRILAFPCNQFGLEEPGTSEQIQEFAAKHHVKFDLFDKIHVNGDDACPVWKFLKKHVNIGQVAVIKSNFTKFLVSKAGVPAARFPPDADEADLTKALEDYL